MGTEEVNLDKDVFTTFDVANICNANITSIKNWIEQGELQAHRTPGGHYRIKKKVLQDFLNRHGMPNPFVERKRKYVFAYSANTEIEDQLRKRFGEIHKYDAADDDVGALLRIGQWRPDAAIIEDGLHGVDALEVANAVRDNLDLRPIKLIVVHSRGPDYSDSLRDAGVQFVVDTEEGDEDVFEATRRALL